MPLHDWARVDAGTFHHFHSLWVGRISDALNEGILPDNFYAMVEQHVGQVIADVLTLSTRRGDAGQIASAGGVALAKAPPQTAFVMDAEEDETYRLARRTLAVRHRRGHRLIAMIEIVSPGNKDRRSHLEQFVAKAASAIFSGVHLLVIDVHPPAPRDPAGIHGAIWEEVGGGGFELPPERPLTLAAYLAEQLPRAFVEPTAVGLALKEMPLFLDSDWYINVPLEPAYAAAYRGVPQFWRAVIEGREETNGDGA